MINASSRAGWVLAAVALCLSARAGATASIGGTVSVVAGSGVCSNSAQVPGNTAQNSFLLSRSTACSGGSASVSLQGSAATASVGLLATSSGSGIGSSQAAGQVLFSDQWQIAVPAGTPFGTINLPVSLALDGVVSPGAQVDPTVGRFIDYSLSIGVPFSFNVLSAVGSVTTDGVFAKTFNGVVGFGYSGQPLKVAVSMSLITSGLFNGTVDFYNTAAISMTLPPGYSATSSSGLPLVFAAVPEPAGGAMLAAGLALLVAQRLGRCALRRR
jgi:hypothetical protein